MNKKHFTNLVDLLRTQASELGEKSALTYLANGESVEKTFSFADLDRQARSIAAMMQEHGIQGGQRVLLLYPPGLEFIAAFFGCLYAGAVAVPMFPPNPAQMARALPRFKVTLEDAQAKMALAPSPIIGMIEVLGEELPVLRQMRWLATDELDVEKTAPFWKSTSLQEDSLAFLQYTSGSTSNPKAVMLSHGNLLANLKAIQGKFRLNEQSQCVSWLPLYHDMGLIGTTLGLLYSGGTATLLSPLDFLRHPIKWLKVITRVRGTVAGGPNFAYELCVKKSTPEERARLDLSSWELAFTGADRIHAATLERFTEAFSSAGFRREAFYPCYGLAEATLMVTGSVIEELPIIRSLDAASLEKGRVVPAEAGSSQERRLVGCGTVPPEMEVLIVDPETRRLCPKEQVGEIWIRGPSVASGYWNQEALTQQIFRARVEDDGAGPFLRTGDLGFLEDGELFVTGRLKDIIIIRGRNHYPEDIEQTVANSHPALRVGGCAAFSVEADGEEQLVLLAEIDRRSAVGFDQKEVRRLILESLAERHQLGARDIVFVASGAVPKTSSGKVQRHASRQQYLARTLELHES